MFVLGIVLIILGITQDNSIFCVFGIINLIISQNDKRPKKATRKKK